MNDRGPNTVIEFRISLRPYLMRILYDSKFLVENRNRSGRHQFSGHSCSLVWEAQGAGGIFRPHRTSYKSFSSFIYHDHGVVTEGRLAAVQWVLGANMTKTTKLPTERSSQKLNGPSVIKDTTFTSLDFATD